MKIAICLSPSLKFFQCSLVDRLWKCKRFGKRKGLERTFQKSIAFANLSRFGKSRCQCGQRFGVEGIFVPATTALSKLVSVNYDQQHIWKIPSGGFRGTFGVAEILIVVTSNRVSMKWGAKRSIRQEKQSILGTVYGYVLFLDPRRIVGLWGNRFPKVTLR
jgi:hypothetical protein